MDEESARFCGCLYPSKCWKGLDGFLNCKIKAGIWQPDNNEGLASWATRASSKSDEEDKE